MLQATDQQFEEEKCLFYCCIVHALMIIVKVNHVVDVMVAMVTRVDCKLK